jgi:spore germination cell wall hydrolase CwlJ-like protein
MINRFQNLLRIGGIVAASFILLAAGEVPQIVDAAPPEVAAPIIAETLTLDSDEAHAPTVELARPSSLRQLVGDIAALPAPPLDTQAKCLARAVFFEARGEPLEGQLAVAQVILNRTQSGKYPASVCGVVDQPRQFTFARRAMNTASSDYRIAQAIAVIAQAERWLQVAPRAMAFHAKHVSPGWGGMERVSRIGNHVFYR